MTGATAVAHPESEKLIKSQMDSEDTSDSFDEEEQKPCFPMWAIILSAVCGVGLIALLIWLACRGSVDEDGKSPAEAAYSAAAKKVFEENEKFKKMELDANAKENEKNDQKNAV